MLTEPAAAPAHSLRCLEVWGGNHPVASAVSLPGLDAWIVSRPYNGDAGGGDVHYLSSCAAGHFTRLLLADVSGHGAEAAPLALTLRRLMHRFVNDHSQTRLVRALSQEFGRTAELGRFATAVVATFSARTGDLLLCNAGHPRPLWYRAASREWSALDPSSAADADRIANIPLGIPVASAYDQLRLRVSPGDLVLMYTDSLVEALVGDGQRLGQEGLLGLLRRIGPPRPERLVDELLDALGGPGPALAGDDLTVLLLHANGERPRASVGVYVKAAARLARWHLAQMRGAS